MGTCRKQLPEKLIRTWFSGFFNLGMRQNLCRFGKGHPFPVLAITLIP